MMINIRVSFSYGEDFKREDITKIVYTSDTGEEFSIEGDAILNHRFPSIQSLFVYAADGISTVFTQNLCTISAFSEEVQL